MDDGDSIIYALLACEKYQVSKSVCMQNSLGGIIALFRTRRHAGMTPFP